MLDLLDISAVLQNQGRGFEVEGYGFEEAENVFSDEAVCVQELEVSNHRVATKGALLSLQVRVTENEPYRGTERPTHCLSPG